MCVANVLDGSRIFQKQVQLRFSPTWIRCFPATKCSMQLSSGGLHGGLIQISRVMGGVLSLALNKRIPLVSISVKRYMFYHRLPNFLIGCLGNETNMLNVTHTEKEHLAM